MRMFPLTASTDLTGWYVLPTTRANQLQSRFLPPHPQIQLLAMLVNLHAMNPVSRPSQNSSPIACPHLSMLARVLSLRKLAFWVGCRIPAQSRISQGQWRPAGENVLWADRLKGAALTQTAIRFQRGAGLPADRRRDRNWFIHWGPAIVLGRSRKKGQLTRNRVCSVCSVCSTVASHGGPRTSHCAL